MPARIKLMRQRTQKFDTGIINADYSRLNNLDVNTNILFVKCMESL